MLGYIYVDTGAMYRAVTLYCINNNFINKNKLDVDKIIENLSNINIKFIFNSKTEKSETFLNDKNVENEIRDIEVSNNVSAISTIPEVRSQMVALQQKMGKDKGIVMDGRDIGTVVFPCAELKIFMTAKPEIRAMRRYNELQENGSNVTFEEIEKNIIERDYIDTHREASPLKKADDAIVLDNSNISIDVQMQWFKNIFRLCQENIKN